MTLAHLIKVVNLYLQTDFPAVENHPLLSQGNAADVKVVVDDLIVTAANSARKWAEMRHDFRCASVTLPVTIPGEGSVSLDDVNGVSLKTLSHCYLTDSKCPVSVVTSKADWYRRYEQQDRVPDGYRQHHVDYNKFYLESALLYDNDSLTTSGVYKEDINVDVHGFRWMESYANEEFAMSLTTQPELSDLKFSLVSGIWPTDITEVTVKYPLIDSSFVTQLAAGTYPVTRIDDNEIELTGVTLVDFPVNGISFPAFYTASGSASTDWFLKHGFEYMQWATIVEVNHLLQTFVQRQEGSLSPPEQMRDRAFEAIRALDVWSSEGGVYHELR